MNYVRKPERGLVTFNTYDVVFLLCRSALILLPHKRNNSSYKKGSVNDTYIFVDKTGKSMFFRIGSDL